MEEEGKEDEVDEVGGKRRVLYVSGEEVEEQVGGWVGGGAQVSGGGGGACVCVCGGGRGVCGGGGGAGGGVGGGSCAWAYERSEGNMRVVRGI